MEHEEYILVKQSVKEVLGINLDYYKDKQMRRRLGAWLARSKKSNWDDYFAFVRTEPEELDRFRQYLTINVSEFFRDAERWQALRTDILPYLLSQRNGRIPQRGLRAWSAGCSIGAEVYSLAMLLDTINPHAPNQLLASDLDVKALDIAQNGGPYSADDIKNVSSSQISTYFQPGGPPFFIKDPLTKKIEFFEHNLLTEPFETDLDLIICRNVVIYFTQEAKDFLFKKFWQALKPGGLLFLGGTEIIPRPNEIGFDYYTVSFYVKK